MQFNSRLRIIRVVFLLVSSSILIGLALVTYFQSAEFRKEEFYERLENRAKLVADIHFSGEDFEKNWERFAASKSIWPVPQEKIAIFDQHFQQQQTYPTGIDFTVPMEVLQQCFAQGTVYSQQDEIEQLAIRIARPDNGNYAVVISGNDKFGFRKLVNLRNSLGIGVLISLIFLGIGAIIFAEAALRPIINLAEEVSKINAGNLDRRLDVPQKNDEISTLARHFNELLERLEQAFAEQKQFVSNASHELRTPLAVMSGQLQHVLSNDRDKSEYRQALQSLFNDTQSLIRLTNSLLAMANAEAQKSQFEPLRLDEVIFAAGEDLLMGHPDYHFSFSYENLPDDERALNLSGISTLLRTAFLNLMENACKFSPNRSVEVKIDCSNDLKVVHFIDQGIGIGVAERTQIFKPFFRSEQARATARGYGVGLALSKKIIEMHGGSIELAESQTGSHFLVKFDTQTVATPANS